jgi:hypothetical protein
MKYVRAILYLFRFKMLVFNIFKWISANKKPVLSKASGIFLATFFTFTALAEPPMPVTDEKAQQQLLDIVEVLSNRIAPDTARQTEALQKIDTTIKNGLSGSSNVGGSNNLEAEQNFRNWTPSSADLVNMVQQGLQTGSLADQIQYYNQRFRIPTGEELTPANPNSMQADYGVFSAVSTNAALGIADKSFDNIAHILQKINFLYRQLDQQRTLKDSTDFGSVVLLQIAALQADLVRLESQQLKMLGVSQQEGNSRRAFAAQFVQDMGP